MKASHHVRLVGGGGGSLDKAGQGWIKAMESKVGGSSDDLPLASTFESASSYGQLFTACGEVN